MLQSFNSNLAILSFRASWRYFFQHRVQFALGLLGIVVGVAAIIAVAAARQAVRTSFEASVAQLDGVSTHRIIALDGQLPQSDYFDLRKAFGDIAMAPVIRLTAQTGEQADVEVLAVDLIKEAGFRDISTQLLGGDSVDSSAWFTGGAVAAVGSLLLERDQSDISLTLDGKALDLSVVQRLDPVRYPGSERMVIMDLGLAQHWAGMHEQLSYVDLQSSREQAAVIRSALPPHLLLTELDADQTGLSAAFELNLLAMGLLAMLMGVLIVFSTFRLMLLQRQRIFALRRLLGNNAAEIAVDILVEALILGVLGAILGIVLGYFLAWFVTGWMQQTVSVLYYDTGSVSVRLTPQMIGLGFAAGIASCLIAALPPLWWAVKVSPLSNSAGDGKKRLPLHLAFSLLLVSLGLFLLLTSGPLLLALAGLFALAVGYVWLAGPVIAGLAGWIRNRVGWKRLFAAVSVRRLPAALNRTAPALAALILAVATIVGVGTMVNSFRSSVSEWIDTSLSADYYLNAGGRPLPVALTEQIQSWPGISGVGWLHTAEVQIQDFTADLSIVDLPSAGLAAYPMRSGVTPWDYTNGPAVMVGETMASRHDIAVGDELEFSLEGQHYRFPVSGIFQDYRSGRGRIVIDRGYLVSPPEQATSLGLYLSPAAKPGTAESLMMALEPSFANLTLLSVQEIKQQTLAIFDRTFLLTRSLRWIVAIVALVGMTGALLALQLERRAELALLHRVGVTQSERRRLNLWESGFLGLICTLLALPLGWLLAWALCEVINLRAFGWHVSPTVFSTDLLLASAVALSATMLAGAFAASSEVIVDDR